MRGDTNVVCYPWEQRVSGVAGGRALRAAGNDTRDGRWCEWRVPVHEGCQRMG